MAINKNFLRLSRQLRKYQTPWEKKLWKYLKNGRFYGLKFKRQVIIERFIYDFSCFEKKLMVELDGSHHTQRPTLEKDKEKENFARKAGCKVLRFYNNDIEDNIEGVLETIRSAFT